VLVYGDAKAWRIAAAFPSPTAATMSWYEGLLDLNVLPDAVVRLGIRKLLRDRLAMEDYVRAAATGPPPSPAAANRLHVRRCSSQRRSRGPRRPG